MAAVFDAKEVAAAVNSLIRLDRSDQQSLLEVIEDYFCPPHYPDSEEDSEESEDEVEEMDTSSTRPTTVDEGA